MGVVERGEGLGVAAVVKREKSVWGHAKQNRSLDEIDQNIFQY